MKHETKTILCRLLIYNGFYEDFFFPRQQAFELQCASGKAVRLIHNLESVTAAQYARRLPLENHPVGGGGERVGKQGLTEASQLPLSLREYIIGPRSKPCIASQPYGE